MKVYITLNGRSYNPWHLMGLKRNPFPVIARAEYNAVNAMLRDLDGDPLTSVDDIRRICAGCSAEFIELCCAQFKPGERVSFTIEFPE